MYLFRQRQPPVRVATLTLWALNQADLQADKAKRRLRFGLLLLLQLLIAFALALALMRPGVSNGSGATSTTVVILDGSASMRSTDVAPSRWEVARARARSLVQQLKPGQEIALIVLGGNAQLLAGPTDDAATLNEAIDQAQPSGQPGNLAEGLSLANGLLANRAHGSIVLLSDGHWLASTSPFTVIAPITYDQIGVTGENSGITSISLAGPHSVLISLNNYGQTPRNLTVQLRADGKLVDALSVRADAGSSTDLMWKKLDSTTQILEARLVPRDVFALDDSAWLTTGPQPRRRVLLVTTQNEFLYRALRILPGVDVTVVDPRNYKIGDYDFYVFDGFLPPARELSGSALLFAPPPGRGPAPLGPAIDPGSLLPVDPHDQLLKDVILSNVHIQIAYRTKVPPGWRPVISSSNGPLLMVHEGYPRQAEFTFDLHHSDLPLRPAFPILARNLLSFLLPTDFENQLFPLGQPITLTPEPDTSSMTITSPANRVTKLVPPFPPYADTAQPGVYTVRQSRPNGVLASRFVVQLEDRNLARILPGPAPQTQQSARPLGVASARLFDIWALLAVFGLALIVIEWSVYLRGSVSGLVSLAWRSSRS